MALIVLVGNYPIAPMGALLVLAWVRWTRTPWPDIGYVKPRHWVREVAAGVAFGIAFKLLMKAVVMPLVGAPAINQAYQYLVKNPGALPVAAYTMIVGGGFGEETVFRGYLFERLGKVLGTGRKAKSATVLVTSAIFALLHYPEQGVAGVEQAAMTGLVFGTIFALAGRIWLLMVAHAAFDLTALAIIYGNLESTLAHAVFKGH
jgi:CAAX protease family protein